MEIARLKKLESEDSISENWDLDVICESDTFSTKEAAEKEVAEQDDIFNKQKGHQ